ncbi:AfsR/SARP family transcriptional regulator [Streptomyces fulvoviolaceus]|uniref:AfsR/SARP family transcriptional regulator n=1 Tax=Streptomyces fulvoviolaceus TaxID=285535 RepID=UPI0021C01CB1|nr:BTAD domain-containing putative transcriptional regulator [Streptomyces fulvoviolaceus]MCT9076531.1 NB-ARC domain-containing protein [Streptomyces fulvoviolaceus]
MTEGTQFKVLGPVRVWRNGSELDVGHPKQRAVLAALLLRDGAQAQMEDLVDAVWGDDPPQTARGVLRTYVCRLRQTLADGGQDVIHRRTGGYALVSAPETVDLRRFEQLVSLAATARGAGDPERAAGRLREGLSLWQGTPLAAIPGPYAAYTRVLLAERRLAAAEDLLACDLDLGRHAQVAAEACALAAEHPLRERLRELQMTALYGAGRQAEALAVFDTTRRLLREELGVDPSAALREVHRRVLAADPTLGRAATDPRPRLGSTTLSDSGRADMASPSAPPTPTGPAEPSAPAPVPPPSTGPAPEDGPATRPAPTGPTDPSVRGCAAVPNALPGPVDPLGPACRGAPTALAVKPAQLPADLADFVGRCAEVERITELGTAADGAPSPTVVIGGMAGIGKTTLAVRCAHRLAPRFPDGQLYVNLRGFDASHTPLPPITVLGMFLSALGMSHRDIPTTIDARAAQYRSLLAGRRILVLLDNARDAQQVRPLLPGTSGCLTLVTSRDQLTGLVAAHDARSVRLPLFDSAHGRDFMARRLGGPRVEADPTAVDEIVRRCGGLPVALAVVCASAVLRPALPLAAVAAELRQAHGSLDAFTDAGEDAAIDVRAVFSWSYDTLSPEAARLFRLLAVHAGPDVTARTVTGLVGLSERQARRVLGELSRAHLLSEQAPGQYVWHDLLRAYAAELHEDSGQAPGTAACPLAITA